MLKSSPKPLKENKQRVVSCWHANWFSKMHPILNYYLCNFTHPLHLEKINSFQRVVCKRLRSISITWLKFITVIHAFVYVQKLIQENWMCGEKLPQAGNILDHSHRAVGILKFYALFARSQTKYIALLNRFHFLDNSQLPI